MRKKMKRELGSRVSGDVQDQIRELGRAATVTQEKISCSLVLKVKVFILQEHYWYYLALTICSRCTRYFLWYFFSTRRIK